MVGGPAVSVGLVVLDRRGETKFDFGSPAAMRRWREVPEDLNGDGKCEVLVRSAQAQVEVFTIEPPNQVRRNWLSPSLAALGD